MFPWAWTGLIGTATVLLFVFGDVGTSSVDVFASAVAALVIVLVAAFGSVISSRQPGNRIAWLFHAISIGLLLVIPASATVTAIDPTSPDFPNFWDYVAIVIVDGLSGSILLAVFLLLFLFPTGRFLTRRWAWAGWISAVFVPAYFLTVLFSEELTERYAESPSWQISNPVGFLPVEVYDSMTSVWILLVMVVAVGGVVAMVVRYRRSGVLDRTQIKWVLYAAAVAAVCLPFGWGDFALAELFSTVSFFLIRSPSPLRSADTSSARSTASSPGRSATPLWCPSWPPRTSG